MLTSEPVSTRKHSLDSQSVTYKRRPVCWPATLVATSGWPWQERLCEVDHRREWSLSPPFELEKFQGRDLSCVHRAVLSSSWISLRIRSFNDMLVTVSIVSRAKNLVDGVGLVWVTNCSFCIKIY